MRHNPGGNQLDRQRRLTPREYALDPWKFGVDPALPFHVPTGGDEISAKVAAHQHQLVIAWRRNGARPSGAEIGRVWGFSKATVSRTMTGHRWGGQTVVTALLWALRKQA